MKKNDYCMVKPLSGEEHVQVSGECMPPAAEQMEQLRKIYGPCLLYTSPSPRDS